MRPTNHKPNPDDELIAHIKHSIKSHEEAYRPGAWEKFNEQQQTKHRPLFWLTRIGSAAAVVALCFSLIWYVTNNQETEQLANTKSLKGSYPEKETEHTDSGSEIDAVNMTSTDQKENLVSQKPKNGYDYSDVKLAVNNTEPKVPVVENNTQSNNVETITAPVVNNEQIIAQVNEKTNTEVLSSLADEIQRTEGKQDKLIKNNKKRWELGFVLAPSFGNTNELNMGYGLSMSYHFSDRLSITSGVAYNRMSAGKSLQTNLGTSPILMGNTRTLEMINQEVVGIDIPVELRYNINKTIYANFGVSGFAVLNQSRRNTFVEPVVIKSTANATSSVGSSAGATGSRDALEGQKGQFANSYIINQRTTERAATSAVEDLDYIGFYNLSFGYTKKVYKNNAIAIEPFVKLPIRMVTQDNLRLIGTGVRLRVGF
ncbi:MAG: hypothetical protein EOO90_10925 [Pedobacter sp.]|nr:MAG: hypothetical protein EOO90_10925 [Pedobacter sp.]